MRLTPRPTDPAGVRLALVDAHQWWRTLARSSWVPAYLAGRRLDEHTDAAGIGYAPPGWHHTLHHLHRLGHRTEAIEAAGLARPNASGYLYDTFRDRLIFPVTDLDHRLVGFLGRRRPDTNNPDAGTPETGTPNASAPDTGTPNAGAPGADNPVGGVPKYLNSPATALYRKHELLYALGEDRRQLENASLPILVEGPADRLAIRSLAGRLGVVGLAPCGTALTDGQVGALREVIGAHTGVAVAYDADPAGQQATVRAWERLTARDGVDPDTPLAHHTSIILPPGQDPAAMIAAGRGDELALRVLNARPLAFTVAEIRTSDIDKDNVLKCGAAVRWLLDTDYPAVPPDLRAGYLDHLSEILHQPAELVYEQAARHAGTTPEHLRCRLTTQQAYPDNAPSAAQHPDRPAGAAARPGPAREPIAAAQQNKYNRNKQRS